MKNPGASSGVWTPAFQSTNPAAEQTGYGWFDRKFIVPGVYYPAIIERELNHPKARTRERAEGIKPPSNKIRSAKNFIYQYFQVSLFIVLY
jgi:hypothetical protein